MLVIIFNHFYYCIWLLKLSKGINTSYAALQDGEVVAIHLHVEETVYAPLGSLGVAVNPVFLLAFFVKALANHGHLVVIHGEEHLQVVDASEVVLL